MNNNDLGFKTTFTGIVRGLLEEKATNTKTGELYSKHFLCVEGKDFNTYNFRFGKESIKVGFHKQLEAYVGKKVSLPVFSMHRAYKDKVYTDHYYAGTQLPDVITDNPTKLPPTKAA